MRRHIDSEAVACGDVFVTYQGYLRQFEQSFSMTKFNGMLQKVNNFQCLSTHLLTPSAQKPAIFPSEYETRDPGLLS